MITLNTSGQVGEDVTGDMIRRGYAVGPLAGRSYRWDDIQPFPRGYIRAMLESVSVSDKSIVLPDPDGVLVDVGFENIATTTLATIIRECDGIQAGDRLDQDMGRRFWEVRDTGNLPNFKPQAVILDKDHKVYLRDY